MLILYHAPTSVCSQKVRVGLSLMGLSYESRELDLKAGDQFAPDYRRLNPDAVVPTLIDGDLVVVESSLILAYLDREHNRGRLMPSDRASRAMAEHWLLRCLGIHAAINAMSFSTAMGAVLRKQKTADEIDALAARFPDPVMGQKRKDLILNGLASPYVRSALVQLRRTLADMQAQLSTGPWMAGEAPGIVDIALVAYIDRLDRLGFAGLWTEGYDRIAPWLAAWQERPAYREGIAAYVPPGAAEQMRAGGAAHWPEVARLWRETDVTV